MITPNPPTPPAADLSALTPGELCDVYREALRAAKGTNIAEATRIDYRHGRYYVALGCRRTGGTYGRLVETPYRRAQVEQMIAALRARAGRAGKGGEP